jgi:transposase
LASGQNQAGANAACGTDRAENIGPAPADLSVLDEALARLALKDQDAARLMTISGIDMVVALGVLAAIGDVKRFSSPEKLGSYLGLNPSVRQSGNGPAHGLGAGRAPGPLRSFFLRIQSRRGKQIAAVATARKLATVIWHLLTKKEDYAWARPALLDAKLRKLELRTGQPTAKGRKPGRAHAYNDRAVRERERAWLEQTEQAYNRFVKNWQDKPSRRSGAANERRHS